LPLCAMTISFKPPPEKEKRESKLSTGRNEGVTVCNSRRRTRLYLVAEARMEGRVGRGCLIRKEKKEKRKGGGV
jgi:hypothetical protein